MEGAATRFLRLFYRCVSLIVVTTTDNKPFPTVAPHFIVTLCSRLYCCWGEIAPPTSGLTISEAPDSSCLSNFTVSHINDGILNENAIILFACLLLDFLVRLICCSLYRIYSMKCNQIWLWPSADQRTAPVERVWLQLLSDLDNVKLFMHPN